MVNLVQPMTMKSFSAPLETPRHAANITLNGRAMHSEYDVKIELARKDHDLICPLSAFLSWSPMLSTRGCVKSYWGLDGNKKYESCRSKELAHRIHVEKMEKGILDLEPIAPAAASAAKGALYAGAGIGAGIGFAGLAVLINALKSWR